MITTRGNLGLAILFSTAFAACAPSGGESGGGAGGGATLEVLKLENRDLQLASHVLMQLADVRRTLDDAMNLYPNTRQQSHPGDLYEFGCRTMKKIWPDPSDEKPSFQERFAIQYNCLDSAQKFSRVDLDGADEYSLAYLQPLPREGEQKPRGIPNAISVNGHTMYSALLRDGGTDEVKIFRKTTFIGQIGGQTETDLVYEVEMQVEDTYDFDVSRTYRNGTFTTRIRATAAVDKQTRKVKFVSPYLISFGVNGTQWDKADTDKASARSNPQKLEITDYSVKLAGPMRLNPDACELPEAKFVITKGEAGEVQVSATGGSISIEGIGTSQLKACDLTRAADPLFAQVLEGIYF